MHAGGEVSQESGERRKLPRIHESTDQGNVVVDFVDVVFIVFDFDFVVIVVIVVVVVVIVVDFVDVIVFYVVVSDGGVATMFMSC